MARNAFQWAMMQRDKRLSGASKHYVVKAGAGGPACSEARLGEAKGAGWQTAC